MTRSTTELVAILTGTDVTAVGVSTSDSGLRCATRSQSTFALINICSSNVTVAVTLLVRLLPLAAFHRQWELYMYGGQWRIQGVGVRERRGGRFLLTTKCTVFFPLINDFTVHVSGEESLTLTVVYRRYKIRDDIINIVIVVK